MLTFVPINLYGENVKKLFCQEGKKDLLLKLTMYHNMVKVAKPFCHNKKNCLQVCVWGGGVGGGSIFFSRKLEAFYQRDIYICSNGYAQLNDFTYCT